MTLNNAMRISASGMTAERTRMDVTSLNIANANSQATVDAPAWRRRDVVLEGGDEGVEVQAIVEDPRRRTIQAPGNPAADANGELEVSNVEPIQEMVTMMSASRAYEANIAAFNSAKGMMRAALQIGKA